jgi:N-acetyltransferase
VDTVLSSPPLPTVILDQCKIFLYLTSSPPPSRKRQRIPNSKSVERVVSVVVAQPINEAMRVLRPGETFDVPVVDSGGGVVCE